MPIDEGPTYSLALIVVLLGRACVIFDQKYKKAAGFKLFNPKTAGEAPADPHHRL